MIYVSKIGFIGIFLRLMSSFKLLHNPKNSKVSPRFVRISVFSHFFDVFIQVVSHQKDFSMVRDEKSYDLYTQKESVTIY